MQMFSHESRLLLIYSNTLQVSLRLLIKWRLVLVLDLFPLQMSRLSPFAIEMNGILFRCQRGDHFLDIWMHICTHIAIWKTKSIWVEISSLFFFLSPLCTCLLLLHTIISVSAIPPSSSHSSSLTHTHTSHSSVRCTVGWAPQLLLVNFVDKANQSGLQKPLSLFLLLCPFSFF